MVRAGMCVAVGVLATVAAWLVVAHFDTVEAAPRSGAPAGDAKPANTKDPNAIDLAALRDAVETAAKRGENVDEIRKALDALEKVSPKVTPDKRVPPELQALRDAVDAANRKGENVEAITKELLTIEMAVAGKSLARPKPPEQRPEPPRPVQPPPFQVVPFNPVVPNPGGLGGGGIDVEMFNKAMELRRKAMELMLKNPRDPEVRKEAEKLQAEATELLLKAARGGGLGGGIGVMPIVPPGFPEFPNFPDAGRIPDRARLGIRLEKVPPLAAEQLGLDPNVGIAVSLVMPGSVAEKVGLKVHDIVLEFAGKPVTDNTEDFINRVNAVKNGEKVDLVVMRKGKKLEVKGVELPAARPLRLPPQPALPVPPLPLPGLLPDMPVKPDPGIVFPNVPFNPAPVPMPRVLPLPAPPVPNS